MAVRADRLQVLDRIDHVLAPNFRQWTEVVDVDVPVGHLPIHRPEAKPADVAGGAVGRDAQPACLRVALVGVDQNLIPRPLAHRDCGIEFIRE